VSTSVNVRAKPDASIASRLYSSRLMGQVVTSLIAIAPER